MKGQHSPQSSFFGMMYPDLVPADYLLRRIADAVDLEFVSELVRNCYCPDNGRPSWDPLVLFNVVFLQFLYDLSDRQVEDQVNMHLATDADSELITAVTVTPGNVADSREFVKLVDPQAREVTADKGYDTNTNHRYLQQRGQRSSLVTKHDCKTLSVVEQGCSRSRRERSGIERKCAEQKRHHGLRQVRYWGLAKVTVQVLKTCVVVNCKRLARLQEADTGPPRAILCPAAAGRG